MGRIDGPPVPRRGRHPQPLAMTFSRTAPCALVLAVTFASTLSAVGCSSGPADPAPARVSADDEAALTSATFDAEIKASEQRLVGLRAAQKAEREAAVVLGKDMARQRRTLEEAVLGRVLIAARIVAKKPKAEVAAAASAYTTDRATLLAARKGIADHQATHKKQRLALEGQLGTLRATARKEANVSGGSGVFALSVLAADYTFGISRRLPSLHTEVVTLRDTPSCRGDLALEGMLDAYLRAAVFEDEAGVAKQIGRIQTQLSCLSGRQLRALEAAMVAEIDTTIARVLGKEGALAATRFRQIVALPLLLLADQNRALAGHTKPGLVWLSKHRAELVAAAATPGTVLHRQGLYLLDPRTRKVVPVGSKAQRAGSLTKLAAGTKNLVFRDAKGALSTNGLPGLVEGLLQPCHGVDLVAVGSSGAATAFTCDIGCGLAKGDAAKLAVPGVSVRAPSDAASAMCGTGGGGGGGGGGTPSADTPPGTGGVTVGGGTSRTQCALGELTADRPGAATLACAASLHPGAGALGGLIGSARSGGPSCKPTVGIVFNGEVVEKKSRLVASVTEGGTTWDVYESEDGTLTFVNEADDSDTMRMTKEEAAAAMPAVADALNEAGADAPADPPPTQPTGGAVPADSPPAAGNPGGGGFAVAAIVASAITTALSETLEALEFMMQSDGSDTEQCSVNPQCMEPNTPQDCSPEQTSCSSGCTGADGAATAFAECVTAANGGTIGTKEEPSVPDLVDGNLINPSPDSTSFGTLPNGALTACLAGGTPVGSRCVGTSVRLCTQDNPNCGCGRVSVVAPPPPNGQCEAMQCVSDSARGELAQGAPTGGAGMCGCSSVMGGI